MIVFARRFIFTAALSGLSVWMPGRSDGQQTDGVGAAKAAIEGALYQAKAVGDTRPVFIDESSFSRVLKAATGEEIDVKAVATGVGALPIKARSEKISCAGGMCEVAENGLVVTIDSLSVSPEGGKALVRYEFNSRGGAHRQFIHIAFVEVEVLLRREGNLWHVSSRRFTKRS